MNNDYSFSPRSQAASAVVGEGSRLSILSGYSPVESGWAIDSMQIVGLEDHGKEHKLTIPGARGEPYFSRMASAVTLSTQEVLVTGGRGMEHDVFLLKGADLQNWVRQKDMQKGRFCHSSAATTLGNKECVLVAGGWDDKGKPSTSVELFSVDKNSWEHLDPLPSPRVDFTLQVNCFFLNMQMRRPDSFCLELCF